MAATMRNQAVMLRGLASLLTRCQYQLSCTVISRSSLHTSPHLMAEFDPEASRRNRKPKKLNFLKYNEVVYPPTEEGEAPRPAEVCHTKSDIKASKTKLWYAAVMIRGMSIEEAIKQLSFNKKKTHSIVKDVLLEAQDLAVKEHNVEYKSNLWVADSFVTKASSSFGGKFRRGGQMSKIEYRYCHYYVRLREGKPPKHYYPPPATGDEQLEGYIGEQRNRRIIFSL